MILGGLLILLGLLAYFGIANYTPTVAQLNALNLVAFGIATASVGFASQAKVDFGRLKRGQSGEKIAMIYSHIFQVESNDYSKEQKKLLTKRMLFDFGSLSALGKVWKANELEPAKDRLIESLKAKSFDTTEVSEALNSLL